MARPDSDRRPRMRLGGFAIALALLALILPSAAAAAVPRNFFGISATLPTAKDFERMGKGGLGAYRLPISWRGVQKTRKGDYRWGGVDNEIRQVADNGMAPRPILFGTPRFISRSPEKVRPPTDSAEDLRLWSKFAEAAARRYGPGGEFWAANPSLPMAPVHNWIVWNEPNARPFWYPRADPKAYAKLVKATDEAISSADPTARLTLGGMYGYPHDRKRSLSAVAFLRAFYRSPGIASHFEAVNLHPYGSGVGTVRKQIKQARGAMRRAGDRNADILIGEMGWATGGPEKSPSVVGTKGQDSRIRKGMRLLLNRRNRWNISGVYVYLWRDFSLPTRCLWCPRAGLLEEDGDAKPSWRTLKRIIDRNT